MIGVSIGSINASLIAGNPRERRVERLRALWERLTKPTAVMHSMAGAASPGLEQRIGAAAAMLWGQPGFYQPWTPFQWNDPAACEFLRH